jgi:hypothetical protein
VTGSVAARFAALCLDEKGRLSDSDYADLGVRGALLVDVALAGRLTQTDDSIDLDDTPLGQPLADRTLAELQMLDGRSLDWWLAHGVVRLGEVATELARAGLWDTLPRLLLHDLRYALRRPEERDRDAAVLAGREPPATPEDAAVTAIAAAAGLAGSRVSGPPDHLVERTGDVAWVCRLVTDFVSATRIEGTAVSRASLTALWSSFPT